MHPRLPKHIHPKEEPQTSHPWLSLARRTPLCPRHAGPGAASLPGGHSGAFPPAPLPEKGKKQPKFFQAVVMKPQLGDRHFPGPEQPLRPGQQRRGAARTRIEGGGCVFWGTAAPLTPSRCVSGPHLIPGRGLEECGGFLWPPACLQQSWALAAGSPPLPGSPAPRLLWTGSRHSWHSRERASQKPAAGGLILTASPAGWASRVPPEPPGHLLGHGGDIGGPVPVPLCCRTQWDQDMG